MGSRKSMAEFGGHSIQAGAWEAARYRQGKLSELHASAWRDLVHGAATTTIASTLPMGDLGSSLASRCPWASPTEEGSHVRRPQERTLRVDPTGSSLDGYISVWPPPLAHNNGGDG